MHLVFSPAALADLDEIWDYTADNWSIQQADAYVDGVVAACRDLAERRVVGRSVAIRQGYLKYVVGSHVIFYRESEGRLDIMRLLHRMMDFDRHL